MKNLKRTISEFRLECCAGIKNPYFNGIAVIVMRIEYIPGENGIGMVYFLNESGHCQHSKTNEFEIK